MFDRKALDRKPPEVRERLLKEFLEANDDFRWYVHAFEDGYAFHRSQEEPPKEWWNPDV